jgi:hypothetical protein
MDLINQQQAAMDDGDYDLGDAAANGGSKKRKLRRLALQDDDNEEQQVSKDQRPNKVAL